MISIKDYASKNNVSYEAVRQQVNRYAKELQGHIVKNGRTKYLDEEAEAFLDEKRKKNPVVVEMSGNREQIEWLRSEKEQLLTKIASQADEISRLCMEQAGNAKVLALAEFNQKALEEKTKELEAVPEKIRLAVEEVEQKKQQEIDALRAELELEKSKSWWDKLRGK